MLHIWIMIILEKVQLISQLNEVKKTWKNKVFYLTSIKQQPRYSVSLACTAFNCISYISIRLYI